MIPASHEDTTHGMSGVVRRQFWANSNGCASEGAAPVSRLRLLLRDDRRMLGVC